MLKQRVITALILIAVLISILFLLPPGYAIAGFSLIAILAAWEWGRLVSSSGPTQVLFPIAVLSGCGFCLQYTWLQLPLCLVAAGFWFMVPLWLAKRWPINSESLGWLVGAVVIVPAWIGMVQLHALGPWVLLAAMALVWVADISAYFVGRAFGRHKLAPAVSPGKTWEGAGGAILGGLLYVFLLRQYGNLPLTLSVAAIFPVTAVLVAISIIGDLFESMIKRQAGVKDSSQLLPGHGGVLDRIDSLTSTLPLMVVAIGLYTQYKI